MVKVECTVVAATNRSQAITQFRYGMNYGPIRCVDVINDHFGDTSKVNGVVAATTNSPDRPISLRKCGLSRNKRRQSLHSVGGTECK